jgi:hypothetical protein
MAVAFLTARFVPGVGVIFSITGSTAVVALIYVFPASFYIRLQKKYRRQGGREMQTQTKSGALFTEPGHAEVSTIDTEVDESGSGYRVAGATAVIAIATVTGAWHMMYVVYLLATGNFLAS